MRTCAASARLALAEPGPVRTRRSSTTSQQPIQERSILPGHRRPARRFEASRPPSRKVVTLTYSGLHENRHDLVSKKHSPTGQSKTLRFVHQTPLVDEA